MEASSGSVPASSCPKAATMACSNRALSCSTVDFITCDTCLSYSPVVDFRKAHDHPTFAPTPCSRLQKLPLWRRRSAFTLSILKQSGKTKSLGDATGLHHIGIHLVRVEPGHDSTQYHVHQGEEEFIYIVSGRGMAELGEDTVEVGPGDFMGFVPGGSAPQFA